MTYKCSGPRFESLKNPYTGEQLDSTMTTSRSGRVLYFAPTSYSPTDNFKSPAEAYRMWNRVNGIEGFREGTPVVCAYTGKPLRLVKTEEGYHYEGGFDIHKFYDRQTYMHFAAMKNGESPYPAPAKEESRVTKPAPKHNITRAARKHAEEMRTELTEDGIRTAENVMKELNGKFGLEKSSTVSMSTAKRK